MVDKNWKNAQKIPLFLAYTKKVCGMTQFN
jgi:hypothetical protein